MFFPGCFENYLDEAVRQRPSGRQHRGEEDCEHRGEQDHDNQRDGDSSLNTHNKSHILSLFDIVLALLLNSCYIFSSTEEFVEREK